MYNITMLQHNSDGVSKSFELGMINPVTSIFLTNYFLFTHDNVNKIMTMMNKSSTTLFINITMVYKIWKNMHLHS